MTAVDVPEGVDPETGENQWFFTKPNAELADKPHHVYRILAKNGAVLYVGCTVDLDRRLAEHGRAGWNWWHLAHACASDIHPSQAAALLVERDLIRKHVPVGNRQMVRTETAYERDVLTPRAEQDVAVSSAMNQILTGIFGSIPGADL